MASLAVGESKVTTSIPTSLIELDLGMCIKTVIEDIPKTNYPVAEEGRRLSSYNMSALPESTDLFSNIPENAYIICIEYTHPDGREQGMDLQIGITGTPKYLEDPVNATKRELKEELGLDASDDYIKSSYFGQRTKRHNTTWHYSTMDASKLTIPTKRTYNDKREDWGRNRAGFYKVMVIPWTTDPVHFINKIEESIKIGGMDQLLADDIKKIVLVPKSVVLEWYPQVLKRPDRLNQSKNKTRNSALSKMLARQGGQKKYRGKTKKNLKQRTNRTKKRNKKLNKKKEIE
jgi:8-oxo-dGTP pyrophosphatase MutT (NUDIX family)